MLVEIVTRYLAVGLAGCVGLTGSFAVAMAQTVEEAGAEPSIAPDGVAVIDSIDTFQPVLVLALDEILEGGGVSTESTAQLERWRAESLGALAGDLDLALDEDLVSQLGQIRPLSAERLRRGRSSAERGGAAEAVAEVFGEAVGAAAAVDGAPPNASLALLRCVERAPLEVLQRRCALSAIEVDASATLDRLEALLTTTPQAAERAVGVLGSLLLDSELEGDGRQRVIELLRRQTKGLRKAALGERAVEPLTRAGVDGIDELLQSLSKGLKNLPIKDDALRARALYRDDAEAMRLLEKAVGGRSLVNSTPDMRLAAGQTLLELDVTKGLQWAAGELNSGGASRRGFAGGPGLASEDLRTAVVDVLAQHGDPRAITVLGGAPVRRKDPVDPVEVWIALALLELGDESRIETVREYDDWYDWAFLAPRMAVALDRAGDRSGIVALEKAYERAVKQSGLRIGGAVLSAFAGTLDQHLDDRKTVKARAWLLKHEIVSALETLAAGSADRAAETAPLLVEIASDSDREVAASAVLALASTAQRLPESWTGSGEGDLFARTVAALAARRLVMHDPAAAIALLEAHGTTVAHRVLATLWRDRTTPESTEIGSTTDRGTENRGRE